MSKGSQGSQNPAKFCGQRYCGSGDITAGHILEI